MDCGKTISISLRFFVLLFLVIPFRPAQTLAGLYLESAHGQSAAGVKRTAITGHGQGNCMHCHEQHSTLEGQDPLPGDGSGNPSVFALFASNFNEANQSGPYVQTDDFCFYCHTSSGGMQNGGGITNKQHVTTFGGYTSATYAPATSILDAFNLNSFHKLYDVATFAKSKFSFFKEDSNPCVACHNPHLAKRNKTDPTDPTLTTISRPTAHNELWGDDATERMNKYTTYRAPYYYNSTTAFEPGGTGVSDGSLTPDYNTFCLDCHQFQVPVSPGSASANPNTPAGYLTAINWSAGGDIHGAGTRYQDVDGNPGSGAPAPWNHGTIREPYRLAPVQNNYVLSCLDCHEPHGTRLTSGRPSSYLLRKEINGELVGGCGGPGATTFCESDFCFKCHTGVDGTWNLHCCGPQGCFAGCHYHGAHNVGNFGTPWNHPSF